MEIFTSFGTTFSLIHELEYPFKNEGNHVLCENISLYYSDPNTRNILLKRGNDFIDIEDLVLELERYNDSKIIWRSNERKKILLEYYTNVLLIMRSYKREEVINKLINSNICTLSLAC